MVKTIFLDLDNTLLDFDRAEAAALSKALEQAGITPSAAVLERYHELNAQHWKMLEDGILTRDQVLTGRFAALFVELGISASAQEICDCYEHLLAQEPPPAAARCPGAAGGSGTSVWAVSGLQRSLGCAADPAAECRFDAVFSRDFYIGGTGCGQAQAGVFPDVFCCHSGFFLSDGSHSRGQPHLGYPGWTQCGYPHLLVQSRPPYRAAGMGAG